MRNLREQLLNKHKTRTSIKLTVMEDVSKTDAMKVLVQKEARRQQKILKTSERNAKVSREQPLQEKLIDAGVLAKDAPLSLKIMQNHAKSLHLQTSGKKDALLILRLSDYYGSARPATDNVEAATADLSVQGQEEEAEDGENNGDDFEGEEATAGDGGIETNPPDQIVVDAERGIYSEISRQ